MAGILTKAGIRSLGLYNGTVKAWLRSLTLRLYSNSHTPNVATDTNASYTECTFSGYVSQAWNDWGDPSLDASNNDQYAAPAHTFTRGAGSTDNQVYGYYATDAAGDVCMAEANGVPGGEAMGAVGKLYIVTGNFYSGQILPPL